MLFCCFPTLGWSVAPWGLGGRVLGSDGGGKADFAVVRKREDERRMSGRMVVLEAGLVWLLCGAKMVLVGVNVHRGDGIGR